MASSSYSGERTYKDGEKKMDKALKRSAPADDDERLMRKALRDHMEENPDMELTVEWIREVTDFVVQQLSEEFEEAWDDVHGGILPADKVVEARREEVNYMVKERKIWSEVSIDECWQKTCLLYTSPSPRD